MHEYTPVHVNSAFIVTDTVTSRNIDLSPVMIISLHMI